MSIHFESNPYAGQRNRYLGDAVTTASPARLVTMLYDRLLLDLRTAEAGIGREDFPAANTALCHAQDIVFELLNGLDTTRWSGGPALASLYEFIRAELVSANIAKDANRVTTVRGLVEPLAEAWHRAAEEVAAGAGSSAPAGRSLTAVPA